jgi:RNA polymerase sigma factor (sigma-70 family)
MAPVEFHNRLLDLESSLLRFAYHLTSKKADAKDLVQETYLRVLLNREKYIDNDKFKTWTFTIMKNIFVDNYRTNYRKNSFNEQSVDLVIVNQADPTDSDDPHTSFSAKEIAQNIDQLNEKLRIPFKMYLSGYKYLEIADELKVNIGTVKKRIFLSRKELMTRFSR